ncbi:dual specificity protein phosphatase 26 isoform X1, partial [Silurus asotus]
LYNPEPNIIVDERLTAFRGCCPFRPYMPFKPAKHCIKIFATCNANTNYKLKQIFTGKLDVGAPEKNWGTRLVLEIAHGLKGHNISCDDFFQTLQLGTEASKEKAYNDITALVSYCTKKGKNILLISTLHKNAKISTKEDQKPSMIVN